MADAEWVKEIMVQLGENLDALGFPLPLEVIEGGGPIGKAVGDARSDKALRIIGLYMKDLGKTFKNLPPQTRQRENVQQAMRVLQDAWAELKLAAND